ncbi:MAG: hypothetical protein O9340_08250 [Cyclobacteriaceae bacterium]|nr:hypothetical protein [Cyclobacteriaceae bacterium]
MKAFIAILLTLLFHLSFAQTNEVLSARGNVRVSFLLYPFTPLVTVEARVFHKVTLQLESNFSTTHGINIKFFQSNDLKKYYFFTGLAFVENKLLREDLQNTLLPYAGVGFAKRFGKSKQWTFDNRFGIGRTIQADENGFYPVIKSGVGRVF